MNMGNGNRDSSARSGDAFASDCSNWKTYKELGCTINKEESTWIPVG